MLIKTSYRDVETKADGRLGKMRIFVIEPNVPEYPDAKFPGCECGSPVVAPVFLPSAVAVLPPF